jgi:hypothetical protein
MSDVANKAKEWINDHRAISSPVVSPEPELTLKAPVFVLKEQLEPLDHCKATVTKWWPSLWPVVDAALSAITTLRLADVDVGIALFLVGKSGTGKSTVFEFIGVEKNHIVEWRDSFTTASLQGHAQGVNKQTLEDRSLIKVCKDKVLVNPDLAMLRTGPKDDQQQRYASILQWMDGKGRRSDSAVHGVIGDRSTSYATVLLAGTTPFKKPTWNTMGMLGPRLMMIQMDKLARSVPEHQFKTAERECKESVQAVISALFPEGTPKDKLTRNIPPSSWPSLSKDHDELLGRYSAITALGQGFQELGDPECEFPTCNQFRRRITLVVIARAVLHGRAAVDDSDLEVARRIARSSTPGSIGAVLLALFEGATTSTEVEERTGLNSEAVRVTLKELESKKVLKHTPATPATVATPGRPADLWEIREDAWEKVV